MLFVDCDAGFPFPAWPQAHCLVCWPNWVTDQPISDRTEMTAEEIQSSLHMDPRQCWSDAAVQYLSAQPNSVGKKIDAHVFSGRYFVVCTFLFSSLRCHLFSSWLWSRQWWWWIIDDCIWLMPPCGDHQWTPTSAWWRGCRRCPWTTTSRWSRRWAPPSAPSSASTVTTNKLTSNALSTDHC